MGGNHLPSPRSILEQFFFMLFMFGLNIYIYSELKDDKVTGKTVLITECTSKLGEQIAFRFSELGAKMVLVGENITKLNVIGQTCHEKGAEDVKTVATGLSKPGRILTDLKQNLSELDILVISQPEIDLNQWANSAENISNLNSVIKENFLYNVYLTTTFMEPLEKNKGRIAIVSTGASHIGAAGSSLLSATNWAMQGFYSALRTELKLQKTGVTITTAQIDLLDSPAIDEVWKDFKRQLNAMEVQTAANMIVTQVMTRYPQADITPIAHLMTYLFKLKLE